MKVYYNHRQEPYFTFLKNGQKTVEGRLQKGWYANVEPGDHIIVQSEDEADRFETEVIAVRKYNSIEEMLTKEDIKKMLPDKNTIEEGVEVYQRFYTKDQEKEFGAVAIEVRGVNE